MGGVGGAGVERQGEVREDSANSVLRVGPVDVECMSSRHHVYVS